jgi:hypothetical protein
LSDGWREMFYEAALEHIERVHGHELIVLCGAR